MFLALKSNPVFIYERIDLVSTFIAENNINYLYIRPELCFLLNFGCPILENTALVSIGGDVFIYERIDLVSTFIAENNINYLYIRPELCFLLNFGCPILENTA